MQRFRWIAIVFTLTSCMLGLCTRTARAQNDPFAGDPVLAQGNPPLTESMVARYCDVMAWLIEVPFNPSQREKLRGILLVDWKDPKEAKADMVLLSLAAQLERSTPDEREFIRVGLQEEILKGARADKKDPDLQWLVSVYDDVHRPIAAGTPPLTESMVSHYVTFIAWLLEIPITPQLKDGQRAMLIQDWKNPKEIENDMRTLQWQLDMAHFEDGQGQRDYVRWLAQPELIKQMRADQSNPDAQALVAAYETAHRPIAAGNFPLTRQDTDAWAELYSFVSTQKGSTLIADQNLKDEIASDVAKKFAKLPVSEQKALSQMRQTWAETRIKWLKSNDAERQSLLASWSQIAPPKQDPEMAAALEAVERSKAFTSRNAATVSEQEMLSAAKDAELIARVSRRQGTQKDLANAATWDDLARSLRAGKEAYRARQANADQLLIMKATLGAQEAMNRATAISNMYVFGDAAMANVITNINNSPYQTVVVPVVPR